MPDRHYRLPGPRDVAQAAAEPILAEATARYGALKLVRRAGFLLPLDVGTLFDRVDQQRRGSGETLFSNAGGAKVLVLGSLAREGTGYVLDLRFPLGDGE